MMRMGAVLLVALALVAPDCLCALHQARTSAAAPVGCCGESKGNGKNPAPSHDDCRDRCAKACKQDREVLKTTSLQIPDGMAAPMEFPEQTVWMPPGRCAAAGVLDGLVAAQGPPAYLRFRCLRC